MTPTPETGPRQVPDGSPLHAFLTEAMYDHGRLERTEPLLPTPEWTVTSSPGEGGDPCPVEAVFPDQSIPCLLSRGHEPPHEYTPDPCPVCNGTGTVWSPDPDGESAYESACPEPGCCCEVGWVEQDTYGGETERQCGRVGALDVDGTWMCEDHAGERGYGPKQEEYGFDPDDGHDPTPVNDALRALET
jgi:hypothetical protein